MRNQVLGFTVHGSGIRVLWVLLSGLCRSLAPFDVQGLPQQVLCQRLVMDPCRTGFHWCQLLMLSPNIRRNNGNSKNGKPKTLSFQAVVLRVVKSPERSAGSQKTLPDDLGQGYSEITRS